MEGKIDFLNKESLYSETPFAKNEESCIASILLYYYMEGFGIETEDDLVFLSLLR